MRGRGGSGGLDATAPPSASTSPRAGTRAHRRGPWLPLAGALLLVICGYQLTIVWRLAMTTTTPTTTNMHPATADRSELLPHKGRLTTTSLRAVDRAGGDGDDAPVDPTRGFILALHDRIVPMGVSLIRELRCLGIRERIEVHHCFPEELSAASRALLTRHDPAVAIVDVCTEMLEREPFLLETTMRTFQSYWVKPLALYHTRLTHVILLDADVVLLRDPRILWELAGYRRTGTTFFYDRISPINKFFNRLVTRRSGLQLKLLQHVLEKFDYAKLGLEGMQLSETLRASRAYKGETCHEQDSSMVAVDKSRAGRAMEALRELIFDTRFHYRFSWGDKEAFWLAYELAHQEYFFSPWGLALVNSIPNKDLERHPNTTCGSMAHYVPVSETDAGFTAAEVLYVNGKALLDPFPVGSVEKTLKSKHLSRLYNINPTHVSRRYRRTEYPVPDRKRGFECIHDQGTAELPESFKQQLMRRRIHYFAAETKYYPPLDQCHEY